MIRDNLYLDPSCKLYLPLRDLDGDNITDRSAHGLVSANNGSVYGLQGRDFNGVDQFIDCGATDHLNISPSLTILAWCLTLTTGVTAGYIYSKNTTLKHSLAYAGATPLYFTLHDNMGGLHLISATGDFDRWHHVAATYDGQTQRIYINAGLKAEAIWTGQLGVADERQLLGARVTSGVSQDRLMDGKIGEIAMYNRALTQNEIDRIYQITKEDYV